MKKNLAYYVYPLRPEMLRFNLQQLSKYYHLFDGEKHAVIATDERSMPFRKTEVWLNEYLPGIKIHRRQNNPALGETAHFSFLLAQFQQTEGIIFYAHTKGVWRTQPDMRPVKKWVEMLYQLNLGCENIDRIMLKYAIAGCFRVNVFKNPVKVPWHYSGTFFWMNNNVLFSRNWQDVDMHRHGVEAFPGKHFLQNESYCIAYDNSPNLYKAPNWEKLNIKL